MGAQGRILHTHAEPGSQKGIHLRRGSRRLEAADDEDIIYPPGITAEMIAAATAARKKRRRSRRRPLWRRPIFIVPILLLVVLTSAAGAAVYRTSGVMSNLRSISTPPPQVTDATFMEEADPDMSDGPITVDTGPARAALDAVSAERSLPRPPETGFGARLRSMASGSGDIANAASIATGIGSGTDAGFTVLVMGVDAQPGAAIDIGVRPDVLMLVRFDPDTRSCRMLSIPRDTRVELPGYGKSKINHALMVGGIPYQLMVTEDFIDQPIDHYLLIDFEAFKQAVDVVGGVEVVVQEDLEKDGQVRYAAGPYRFNGEEALAYVRFRTPADGGDIGRVERTWSVLAGLAKAAQGRDLITDVNTLVPTVEEHIRTDLTLTEMATIARDYGDKCLTIDRDSIAMTAGSRVQFNDPILNKPLYYNVVSEATVEERMEQFLGGPSLAPGEDVQATPSPQVEATPSPG